MCVCVHAYHLCTGPMVVRRACSILRRWSYRWLQAFWRGCWKPNSGPGRAIHTLDHWAISSDSSINLKKKTISVCVCMWVHLSGGQRITLGQDLWFIAAAWIGLTGLWTSVASPVTAFLLPYEIRSIQHFVNESWAFILSSSCLYSSLQWTS